MQKVGRVIQTVIRVHEGLANRELVTHCGNGGHLGDQSECRHFAMPWVRDLGGVVIERREGTDHPAHDGHGVRITSETVEEGSDLLMDHGVPSHDADELVFLLGGRQLAIEQQIAGFEIVRMLGQLLYRITPVKQHPLLAVDKGNLRFAGCGGSETGVVGEVTVGGQLAHIHHIRAQCARVHTQIDGLLSSILMREVQGGVFVGHRGSLPLEIRGCQTNAERLTCQFETR